MPRRTRLFGSSPRRQSVSDICTGTRPTKRAEPIHDQGRPERMKRPVRDRSRREVLNHHVKHSVEHLVRVVPASGRRAPGISSRPHFWEPARSYSDTAKSHHLRLSYVREGSRGIRAWTTLCIGIIPFSRIRVLPIAGGQKHGVWHWIDIRCRRGGAYERSALTQAMAVRSNSLASTRSSFSLMWAR